MFGTIAVVQAICATVPLLSLKVLGVVHVGIVLKAIPVDVAVIATPILSESTLVGRRFAGNSKSRKGDRGNKNQLTKHSCFPPHVGLNNGSQGLDRRILSPSERVAADKLFDEMDVLEDA